MKTSNFLLFFAIYGFLVGSMMLFNAHGSLVNYAVQPIDQYHIVILQYLGLVNISAGLLVFLLRNEQSKKVINAILLYGLITCVGSFLKACYDIFLKGVPSNTFFWADMSFRLLVGLVCAFYLFKISKKTA
jgi:cytochrome c biogenesis protein CcdA